MFHSVDQAHSTIAAIATGQSGPSAAVAIIRVSGPKAWPIAHQMFRTKHGIPTLKPGTVLHGWFVDPTIASNSLSTDIPDSALLDEGLLLCFQGPHSFTGEDVIELHCHGGVLITHLLLDWCCRLGAEPAGPGAFTKRAILNGKLDLTQAESIMDLISSHGAAMAKMAVRNLRSRTVSKQLGIVIDTVADIQAHIVACVDFPEEVEEPSRPSLLSRLKPLQHQVNALVDASERNRMIRDGMTVAILGLPNSGKSSLFNALLASDRAIVSDIAGTTRDTLTEQLVIEGIPITLVDTAGIRESENSIEILGIERSWQVASHATGILYLFDATIGILREDKRILGTLQTKLPNTPILLIANKVDTDTQRKYPTDIYQISAKTGEGLPLLTEWLKQLLLVKGPEQTDLTNGALCLNHRQTDCLKQLALQLDLAIEALETLHSPIDLASFPLTQALRAGEQLLGRDTTESVLDQVFSQFCVGK